MRLGDFDLYRRAVTVLGKGNKRRQIPISIELVNTVDEYLLTEYPVLERLPTLTDHLWFPVHKLGDRILTLTPEKPLGYSNFWAWWTRVETRGGRPAPQAAHDETHVCDRYSRRNRGKFVRRPGPPRALLDPRHRDVSALLTAGIWRPP